MTIPASPVPQAHVLMRYLHTGLKLSIIFNFWAEQEVAKLSEGHEDHEEHDRVPDEVLGTGAERHRELSHRLVETDKLKKLKQEARFLPLTTTDTEANASAIGGHCKYTKSKDID